MWLSESLDMNKPAVITLIGKSMLASSTFETEAFSKLLKHLSYLIHMVL